MKLGRPSRGVSCVLTAALTTRRLVTPHPPSFRSAETMATSESCYEFQLSAHNGFHSSISRHPKYGNISRDLAQFRVFLI